MLNKLAGEITKEGVRPARSYFRKLTEVAAGEERPELTTARAKIRE